MPYEVSLNIVEILRTTLYLLEHTIYAGKEGSTIAELKRCIRNAIATLEAEMSPNPAD